mgnify:CR=1 FL=1
MFLTSFYNKSYAPYVETSVIDYLELVQHVQSFSLLETPALTLEFVWLPAIFYISLCQIKVHVTSQYFFPVKVCIDCKEIFLSFFFNKHKLSEGYKLELFLNSFRMQPHTLALKLWHTDTSIKVSVLYTLGYRDIRHLHNSRKK